MVVYAQNNSRIFFADLLHFWRSTGHCFLLQSLAVFMFRILVAQQRKWQSNMHSLGPAANASFWERMLDILVEHLILLILGSLGIHHKKNDNMNCYLQGAAICIQVFYFSLP